MRTLDKYIDSKQSLPPTAHVGYVLRTSFVIKGIMRPDDAEMLEQAGIDALWVSNHGGRQFDGAPASIEVLPEIRSATNLPLIFDSGVAGGLDILRALSMGADFVMLGRAFCMD